MQIAQILEAFFVALVVSYSLIPFIKRLALRFGYLDHPHDNKVHAHPTPLLGGLAIFFAFLIAVLTKVDLISSGYVQAMIGGIFILIMIGLIDDKMGMMPNIKLLGQFLAALVAIKAGVRIEFFNNYYLDVIFSYLWIIGITNAFNLLDNMNGLSAGIAVISAAFLGTVAYMSGQGMVAALSFAVAGSALGFLKHNFPKASIFMGDAGSLVLGYLLATIAILASWKTSSWTTSIMIPILILGYPIFDTTLVTVVRMLERRSIFQGGKDHSSHRLALLGLKRFRAVLVIYGVCVFLGLAAVTVTKAYWTTSLVVAFLVFMVMLVLGLRLALVDTKRFGRKKK
ncbi:MAG: undecaprenyl/decaprenyl-phosphate alpha-N-acetylglucosaminyl 1-phosphate transferase [Candidatus Omnitrophica bacterium]|nr:undecaprenyl/decaprenyl-phosphate alpha-N-acetylglucosaminyl 1-phosphate transferase [Candidatus Omnitrophota bacterium]